MTYPQVPVLKSKSLQIQQDVMAAEAKHHARTGGPQAVHTPLQTGFVFPTGVQGTEAQSVRIPPLA